MIDPGQLAGVLELLAQALRALPPGAAAAQPLASVEPGKTVGEVIEQCRASGDPGPTMIRKTGGGRLEVSSLSNAFASCFAAVMGASDPGPRLRPSLHEVRSLSARLYKQQCIDVQTLLGHKDAEVTAMYVDDRGLTAHEWKLVALPVGE